MFRAPPPLNEPELLDFEAPAPFFADARALGPFKGGKFLDLVFPQTRFNELVEALINHMRRLVQCVPSTAAATINVI